MTPDSPEKKQWLDALETYVRDGRKQSDFDRLDGIDDALRAELARVTAEGDEARKLLVDGLTYHEHDGHGMPKRVAREALAALGVPEEKQP